MEENLEFGTLLPYETGLQTLLMTKSSTPLAQRPHMITLEGRQISITFTRTTITLHIPDPSHWRIDKYFLKPVSRVLCLRAICFAWNLKPLFPLWSLDTNRTYPICLRNRLNTTNITSERVSQSGVGFQLVVVCRRLKTHLRKKWPTIDRALDSRAFSFLLGFCLIIIIIQLV